MSLEKPKVPAMNELEDLIGQLNLLERKIKEIKKSIQPAVIKIAEQYSDETEKLDAMKYIYWCVPEVHGITIAKAVGVKSPNLLSGKFGSVSADIPCDRCNSPISYSSRTELQNDQKQLRKDKPRYAEGYNVICESCQEDIYLERIDKFFKDREDYRKHLQKLKTMPYKQYLQTPEWRQRRIKHLKNSGYKCQVCNKGEKTLHVHHRTYERRGNERYNDLIVLCEDCHELYHFNESKNTTQKNS